MTTQTETYIKKKIIRKQNALKTAEELKKEELERQKTKEKYDANTYEFEGFGKILMEFKDAIPQNVVDILCGKTKDQTIIVIDSFECAYTAAYFNSVLYITRDKDKYNKFKQEVCASVEFGNDDEAVLVDDVKKYASAADEAMTKFLEKNGIMKFDVAITISHPPYCRGLYLKIIEKVLEHADEVVNLSPIAWLEDMPSVYGIMKSTLQKHEALAKSLVACEKFNPKKAYELFNIGTFVDLGLQHYKHISSNFYKTVWNDGIKLKSVFDKVIVPTANGNILSLAKGKVNISLVHGNPGSKDEYDIISPQFQLLKEKNVGVDDSILMEFAKNVNTKIMKYMHLLTRVGQHIFPQYIPYPSDANIAYINSLLTDEEKAHVDKVMEPYMWSEIKK